MVQAHLSKNKPMRQASKDRQTRNRGTSPAKTMGMKRNATKTTRKEAPTLGELISTVNQLTRDEQLGAFIVADLINSRKVRLEGEFQGRRVVFS
jgi:hypothetical protein